PREGRSRPGRRSRRRRRCGEHDASTSFGRRGGALALDRSGNELASIRGEDPLLRSDSIRARRGSSPRPRASHALRARAAALAGPRLRPLTQRCSALWGALLYRLMRLVKIGVANVNATVGAVRANADRCIRLARAMAQEATTIGVFPEQVIGGYPSEDLVQWR